MEQEIQILPSNEFEDNFVYNLMTFTRIIE